MTTVDGFDLIESGEVFRPCDLCGERFSRWCAHCLDVNGLVGPHDKRLPYLRRVKP